MKKIFFLLLFSTLIIISIFPKVPNVDKKDIIFVKSNKGYDLYIKKIPGINSILLTDAQKDPALKKTNYGLRTPTFQECNGNEKRILDGKVLQTKYDVFFLVDSTTEKHPKLGESFHFFFPEKVLYGYGWSGGEKELQIKPGVEINLRLFEKLYADYTGAFIDQWIRLELAPVEDKFNPGTIDNLTEIAKASKGIIKIKNDNDDLSELFKSFIVDNVPEGDDADVVLVVDTTYSMKEEIPVFQRDYPAIRDMLLKKIKHLRLGLIVYRDYGESYFTIPYDLTDDIKKIDYLVGRINVDGGGDIPEAMYEALYELKNMTYKSGNRIVFLFADAPAHPVPRGKISKDDVFDMLKELNIKINPICLPVR